MYAKNIWWVHLLIVLCIATLTSANCATISENSSFKDALANNHISADFHIVGEVLPTVHLQIHNRLQNKLTITCEIGTLLNPVNTTYQQIVICDSTLIQLLPLERKSVMLSAFCLQHSKTTVPFMEMEYGGMLEGDIVKLLGFISANNLQKSKSAQAAVWFVWEGVGRCELEKEMPFFTADPYEIQEIINGAGLGGKYKYDLNNAKTVPVPPYSLLGCIAIGIIVDMWVVFYKRFLQCYLGSENDRVMSRRR